MARIRIRRAIRAFVVTAIAGSLLALAPGSAHAEGADVDTAVTIGGTATVPFVNQCTGDTGTVTISFNGVSHQVARPTDTFMAVNNIAGDFTLVLDDPALLPVTGHFTSLFTVAGGVNDVFTTHLESSVVTASDGTKFIGLHLVSHLTENGLEVTVVDFEKGCP